MILNLGQPVSDANGVKTRWFVKSEIAAGRNYQIYLAEDTALLNKIVALKVLKYDGLKERQGVIAKRAQLENERKVLTLQSPLIPEPLDYFFVTNRLDFFKKEDLAVLEPCLVYEYQHGKTLRAVVSEQGPFDPERAKALLLQLCPLLAELHQAGFIFRDLNPDHIIMCFDDIIHVVGTGNICPLAEAKNTASCRYRISLSPQYSAPEFFNQAPVQNSSDIYSLGRIALFVLTGADPIPGSTSFASAVFEFVDWGPVLKTVLNPNDKERFQKVEAFEKALKQARRRLPSRFLQASPLAPAVSLKKKPGPGVVKWLRGHKALSVCLTALLILILLGLILVGTGLMN